MFLNFCLFLCLSNPRFAYFNNTPATPVDPEITGFTESYSEFGYNSIGLDFKLSCTDGEILSPDLIKYILWVKVDGEPEPFVFYPGEYYSLTLDGIDELTVIAILYDKTLKKVVNCNKTHVEKYDAEGISVPVLDAPVAGTSAYYSLDGKLLSAPSKGVTLVRQADGRFIKVMR